MNHISLERLETYSRNKVPPEDLAALEEHLLVCGECQAALDRLEAEAGVIRQALLYYIKPDTT